ncbi:AIM24 family protein, partial [Shewanella sp.]
MIRKCHEVDYEIIGTSMQLVEIELDPNEAVVAEAGAMTYLEEDISFEAKMGDGSEPESGFFGKLWGAGKRAISGEGIFMTHFTNEGHQKRKVAFSAPFPGTILAIDLAEHQGELICQKDSFLAAALGTQVTMTFNKRLGVGFLGGEGFILQSLKGDGMVF